VKRSRLVALGLTALLVPGLAGCWSGNQAATTMQSASGDGTQITTTDITIDSATIVAGDPGSGKAAFLGTVYNPTDKEDALLSVVADGVQAKLTPEPVPVRAQEAVPIQTGRPVTADLAGMTAAAGEYVEVSMTFQNAGKRTFSALVVPPSGFYAEAAPEGTTPIPVKVNTDTHLSGSEEGSGSEEAMSGTEGEGAAEDAGASESEVTEPRPAGSAEPEPMPSN